MIGTNDQYDETLVHPEAVKIFNQLCKLEKDDVFMLCAVMIVVHNKWNWNELYNQLKTNQEKDHGK